MDKTASLLLFGVGVIGLMVLLQALIFFLPAIVLLLLGYFPKSDYWKQHPGLWKLWVRYRFRIAWSHFAGAMWKERNDDEFITYKFKEELEKTVNASVGNTRVDWEEQRKRSLAIDTTKPLWEGWKASEREMTGPLNGWKPFLAWEKPDPALEGKTVLNLPKTLFVASDTSSDLPGDNISRSTTTGLPPIFVPTCELVKTVSWHPHSFIGLATS